MRFALNAVRRVKDAVELARMRRAVDATRAGFAVLRELVEPGRTERELQIELEAAFLRAGADALAFDTIVGSGPNAAVLHFPPSQRALAAGELVLVDAGAEHRAYAADVTRTYPVGDGFSADQQALHALVEAAVGAAIERCTPGTEWRDVHRTAARVIAEGLARFGLLRGDPDDLVERGSVFLFLPHGVGHMVGLGVRDAGGLLPDRPQDPDAFPRLRVDLPLEAGHVMTVEPGIYFVPALLRDEERRRAHRDAVDWDLADRMTGFGGIRIEHDVLVTAGVPDVLTREIPALKRLAWRARTLPKASSDYRVIVCLNIASTTSDAIGRRRPIDSVISPSPRPGAPPRRTASRLPRGRARRRSARPFSGCG